MNREHLRKAGKAGALAAWFSLKTVHLLLRISAGLLLAYAVVFALVGTVVIIKVATVVRAPVDQVRYLVDHNPVETPYMALVREELANDGGPDSLVHSFIPLDSIAPILVEAVIAAEDDGFRSHPGIDVAAIVSAAEYNRTHNKIHGGSTITQQVAKNLFLSGERTYRRKIEELAYAILMENTLGKDRILELYLNYAQWGPDLFGCEAAARRYYGRSCRSLSLHEAVNMAATLARPSRLTPHHSRSILMGKRVRTIAGNLYYKDLVNDSAYTALCGLSPPIRGGAAPPQQEPPQSAENSDDSAIEQ